MPTLPQWRVIRLIRRIGARGSAIDAGTQSAALTYQALLSLIPLVIFAGAVLGFVFANDQAKADYWTDRIAQTIPGLEQVVGSSIDSLVDARVSAGVLAVLVLVWTGSSLAGRCSHVIVRAFGLPPANWIRRRLLAVVEILLVGVAGFAGIVITTVMARDLSVLGVLLGVAVILGTSLTAYVVFTPAGGPPWRRHLPGAGLLGAAIVVLTVAGSFYVQQIMARATAVYGTIAAVIGLLAVLSLGANAYVYGAVLSSVVGDDADAAAGSPST